MSKRKNTTNIPERPRDDPRMWRVNQRAHKFADKRKAASRKACRGKVRV